MFTRKDMERQVREALDAGEGGAAGFDVDKIIDDIQDDFGTVDLSEVPSAVWWSVVQRHDRSA